MRGYLHSQHTAQLSSAQHATPQSCAESIVALQAVCFLRPTRDNIASLRRELREPHFGEYSLCTPSLPTCSTGCMRYFSNVSSQCWLLSYFKLPS